MQRKIKLAICAMVATCIFCVGASANGTAEIYEEQFNAFSANEIMDKLAPSIRQMLDEEKIISAEKAAQITSPKVIIENALSGAKAPLKNALDMMSSLLMLILIMGIFSSFELSDKSVQAVVSTVSALAIATVCFQPIAQAAKQMCDAISVNCALTAATLPVSAAITASTGSVTQAAVIQGRTALVTALMSFVTAGAVLPLTESGLALSVVASSTGNAKLSGIVGSIKKVASTLLSIAVTVVSASLILQSVLAKTADNATVKTIGYTVSSFVPVVGGPLSEVLKTVVSCSELLGTTVAAVSMVSVLVMSAQPFFTVVFMQCAIRLCASVAQMTGEDSAGAFLSELASLLSILIAVFLSALVLLLLAIGLAIV